MSSAGLVRPYKHIQFVRSAVKTKRLAQGAKDARTQASLYISVAEVKQTFLAEAKAA